MEPHQQRVVDEKVALDEKLARLEDFMKSQTFLKIDPDEQSSLSMQAAVMRLYSAILGQRIKHFGEGGGT